MVGILTLLPTMGDEVTGHELNQLADVEVCDDSLACLDVSLGS